MVTAGIKCKDVNDKGLATEDDVMEYTQRRALTGMYDYACQPVDCANMTIKPMDIEAHDEHDRETSHRRQRIDTHNV